MRYLVLACDYDGTLAYGGQVRDSTIAALERCRASGRKLILVTGRELDDLRSVFPRLDLFERVVAENGALLFRPASREEVLLAEAPPRLFVQELQERGIAPLGVGRIIVATSHPNEAVVLDVIREHGLELQVIFNKGSVMVLPAGVNKASGLAKALDELGISPHNAVAVGDAENDHALLALCECAVAVANALPALKERADLVTQADHGAGVEELIGRLLDDDLGSVQGGVVRHQLLLGTQEEGSEVQLAPYGYNLMIAGPSGSGKSTVAAAFLERLIDHHYQFCVIDPEGDYETFAGAVEIGTHERGPSADEVMQLLKNPTENVIVNLVGLPLADRPGFFLSLLPPLQELRVRTGRPHWLVLDEAHHLLPASMESGAGALLRELGPLIFITVHPDQVAASAASMVDVVIAVGPTPGATLGQFCGVIGQAPPAWEPSAAAEEVVLWDRRQVQAPVALRIAPSRTDRRRHTRKYAQGELPPDRSFYFRGPNEKLNLRAQNLILFMQLAEGVDDATWTHHLRHGDYSRWFREMIKDRALADQAAQIENQSGISALESRKLMRQAIEQHYTMPESTT